MNQETLIKLKKPFDIKIKPGKGNFKYIDSKDVINRMNDVFSGVWSTEVIVDKIIEDQLLIGINVRFYDSDISMWVNHVGYGSSQVARYAYGENAGKIIDIGNTYKSALAKAIRSACTKTGAGLYLNEEDELLHTTELPTIPASVEIPDSDVKTQPVKQSGLPSFPSSSSVVVPVGNTQPAAIPSPPIEKPSVPQTSVPPMVEELPANPISLKGMTPVERIKLKNLMESEAVETDAAPDVATPSPTHTAAPTPPSVPPTPLRVNQLATNKSDVVDYISDVQMTALKGTLDLRKLEYYELAKEAFTQDGRWDSESVPEDPQKLLYDQAVVVIKYGNDKNRKLM